MWFLQDYHKKPNLVEPLVWLQPQKSWQFGLRYVVKEVGKDHPLPLVSLNTKMFFGFETSSNHRNFGFSFQSQGSLREELQTLRKEHAERVQALQGGEAMQKHGKSMGNVDVAWCLHLEEMQLYMFNTNRMSPAQQARWPLSCWTWRLEMRITDIS